MGSRAFVAASAAIVFALLLFGHLLAPVEPLWIRLAILASLVATATTTLGDLMTERSAAFQSTIDRLQSLPYDNVTTGADSVGVFAISWSSANDGPQSKLVTLVTVGPGVLPGAAYQQSPSVADTFVFRILRN